MTSWPLNYQIPTSCVATVFLESIKPLELFSLLREATVTLKHQGKLFAAFRLTSKVVHVSLRSVSQFLPTSVPALFSSQFRPASIRRDEACERKSRPTLAVVSREPNIYPVGCLSIVPWTCCSVAAFRRAMTGSNKHGRFW